MMGWFRTNRTWTGRLALLALALQLVLSFGHHHALALSSAASLLAAQTVAMPTDTGLPGQPDEDRCSVCAVLHLAGSLTLPPLVVLPVPAPLPTAWVLAAARRNVPLLAGAFHARAPPAA